MKLTFFTFIRSAAVAAASACVLALPRAEAVTVNLGPLAAGGVTTEYEYRDDYAAWIIGDFSADPDAPGPIEVTAGPSHGVWTQQLTFGAGFGTLETGDELAIQQLLAVSGSGFSFSNFKATLVTPDWEWVVASVFDNASSLEVAGLAVGYSGATVSFDFAPLADGTEIYVAQYLRYTGPDGPPAPIQIQVSAVPEPAGALIGAVGAASLFLRRRR